MTVTGADIHVNGEFDRASETYVHLNNDAPFEIGDVNADTAALFAQNVADIVLVKAPESSLLVTVVTRGDKPDREEFKFTPSPSIAA